MERRPPPASVRWRLFIFLDSFSPQSSPFRNISPLSSPRGPRTFVLLRSFFLLITGLREISNPIWPPRFRCFGSFSLLRPDSSSVLRRSHKIAVEGPFPETRRGSGRHFVRASLHLAPAIRAPLRVTISSESRTPRSKPSVRLPPSLAAFNWSASSQVSLNPFRRFPLPLGHLSVHLQLAKLSPPHRLMGLKLGGSDNFLFPGYSEISRSSKDDSASTLFGVSDALPAFMRFPLPPPFYDSDSLETSVRGCGPSPLERRKDVQLSEAQFSPFIRELSSAHSASPGPF